VSKITPRDIDAITRLFEAGEWRTLELQLGGTEIFLSKVPDARPSWDGASNASLPRSTPQPASAPTVPGRQDRPPAAAVAQAPATHEPTPDGHVVVTAPSLGTFYRAPKPGAPSFIDVGQDVTAGTELCLIEVMKLFTTLRAGVSGRVARILVEDGAMIELGQPLFVIDARG
jgi:acetyl-CoA carboxylase biotin carboxyl carrier protein